MAYLFLDTAIAEPPTAKVTFCEPASARRTADLTRLEWSVVALASLDRLSSLRKPGRFGIACGYLFGKRHNPELADPHLEVLRRIAVLVWHDSSLVPHAEYDAFIAAGFTPAQYDLLMVRIASQQGRPAARAHW